VKKDILAVDDDKDILQSIKDIFEYQGHEVFTTNNAIECIDKLKKGFQGILLIDLIMPSIDGWDIIREIVDRGFEKNIDIIVVTGVGTSYPNKMKGLEPYVYDYISKPFDINKLVESIRKLT
jgi:DNA-binding response OmpR family regulator